ncbi:bacillithiol biosynthesis cysteine-adding enzyme BshC [Paenibacillus cremeus]|uniref:Putative cysteine ligase BshC n=1 Tax=Paenibacillus cremeus TaxID=2163881 RepID=A0A559KC11_9BACL|nr:bacillithiol biosynthesis cysteine-adding enzyme BshC [Paenibacillus cremeus]TVY09670.1 bacillithiol biosynthesis cysteine-adding enzyme BshC [Paenibacillus cremeus]
MQVEAFHWESGQPLTEDYIHRFDQTGGLYEYNPWDPASWKERAAWLDCARGMSADRSELVRVLASFNERAGASPETLANVRLLGESNTLAVVGGQQASLFTGPLLVIYKAITLISMARQASEKLQRPVVPVFWIAGEDHDFDEVNHLNWLTSELKVEKVKLEHPTGIRTSVSQTKISPEQWETVLEQLEKSLLPTEFRADLMASLQAMAGESVTLVDLFARFMAQLFGPSGLVLLDSDDPEIRQLEAPMFRLLVERNGEMNQALLRSRARLVSNGYQPQVELHDRGANLFVYDQGERVLLYSNEEGGFTDRRGERQYTREQLLDWAVSSPERLSNNVMTRPLMQDFLFPVLGTVLGPAEIAYWGLTRDAFEWAAMQMPILIPRFAFTLLEGTIQKNMTKYGLTLDDVLYHLEERQQAWLREQDQLKLDDRFAEVKTQFREHYEPLIEALAGINPGLKKLGDTNLGKIIEQIEFLEQKAGDGLRQQFDSGLRQFQRIGMSVLPGGKPQERLYNVIAYLNKYGDGWLKTLLELPIEMDGKHRICYM